MCVLYCVPAVLTFLAVSWALIELAVMLGNVKGFHLDGPASQGRGKRVCSTLAVGTLGTAQEGQLDSGHASAGHAMLWKFCGQVYVGLESVERDFCFMGFSSKCSA